MVLAMLGVNIIPPLLRKLDINRLCNILHGNSLYHTKTRFRNDESFFKGKSFHVLLSVAIVWCKLHVPIITFLFSFVCCATYFWLKRVNEIVKSREVTFQEFVFTKGTILKLTTAQNALQTKPVFKILFPNTIFYTKA